MMRMDYITRVNYKLELLSIKNPMTTLENIKDKISINYVMRFLIKLASSWWLVILYIYGLDEMIMPGPGFRAGTRL